MVWEKRKKQVYTFLGSCRAHRELILKPQGKKYWHGFRMMNDVKYWNKTWWIHSSCQCTATEQSNWDETKISYILTGFWFRGQWGRETTTDQRFDTSLLLQQSAKLGYFSLHLKQNGVILLKNQFRTSSFIRILETQEIKRMVLILIKLMESFQ